MSRRLALHLAAIGVLLVWLTLRVLQVQDRAPEPKSGDAEQPWSFRMVSQGDNLLTSVSALPSGQTLQRLLMPCPNPNDAVSRVQILEDGIRIVRQSEVVSCGNSHMHSTVDLTPLFLDARHVYSVRFDTGRMPTVKGESVQGEARYTSSASSYMRWRFFARMTRYPVIGVIATVCSLLLPRWGLFVIPAAYALLTSYLSFINLPFGPYDEGGHFVYAWHVAQHGSLPLTTMMQTDEPQMALMMDIGKTDAFYGQYPIYEAVHPPLFYGLCALVMRLVYTVTHSMGAAFFGARLLGVGMVALAGCFVIKAYHFACQQGFLERDDKLYGVSLATIFMSRNMVLIGYAISNDHIVTLLGALFFYLILRVLALDALKRRSGATLGFATSALWLSKFTTVWCIPVALVPLLRRLRVGDLSIFAASALVFAVPLHVHYFNAYHALTGAAHHIAFVLKIVNPGNQKIPIAQVVNDGPMTYFGHFFSADEPTAWLTAASATTGMILFAGCLVYASQALKGLYAWRLLLDKSVNKVIYFRCIVAACCMAPVAVLTCMTLHARIWVLYSRYGSVSCGAYALALFAAYRVLLRAPVRFTVACTCLATSLTCSLYYVATR